LRSQQDSRFSFHIEHVIAEKHGGETRFENLALSCPECNAFKGSDVGSYDRQTGLLTPLYNPRREQWTDHFRLESARIEPLTPEGRVTVSLLQLNRPEQVAERELLIRLGRYPCLAGG
jgi:5-methylcytosine-specific restriction endonuclease McrA